MLISCLETTIVTRYFNLYFANDDVAKLFIAQLIQKINLRKFSSKFRMVALSTPTIKACSMVGYNGLTQAKNHKNHSIFLRKRVQALTIR